MSYLLLFIGGFIAAAISGAAGFGGALLIFPLLIQTVGAEMSVPVLTIAQLIGNLSRGYFGYKMISWRPVWLFLIGAIPMSIAGAFLFVDVPKGIVSKLIGISIIGFVVLTHYKIIKIRGSGLEMVLGGGIVGFLSGLVGSAGPIGAALFLQLNLPPVAYIASEAVTAAAMHITKTVIYQKYLEIGIESLKLGLFIGVAMIGGTWAGKKIIEKLPQETFKKVVAVLLIVIGAELIFWGQ